MRRFEVRQNGRILFVIVARSLAAARRLIEAHVIGPVDIVRCKP